MAAKAYMTLSFDSLSDAKDLVDEILNLKSREQQGISIADGPYVICHIVKAWVPGDEDRELK